MPADPENANHRIPIEELSRQDPILFYTEIPLFEDELHDNGSSSLLIRAVSQPIVSRLSTSQLIILDIARNAHIILRSLSIQPPG